MSIAIAALFQVCAGGGAVGLVLAMVATEGHLADLPLDPRALAKVAVPWLLVFDQPLAETFARPDEAVIFLASASTILYGAVVHVARQRAHRWDRGAVGGRG